MSRAVLVEGSFDPETGRSEVHIDTKDDCLTFEGQDFQDLVRAVEAARPPAEPPMRYQSKVLPEPVTFNELVNAYMAADENSTLRIDLGDVIRERAGA